MDRHPEYERKAQVIASDMVPDDAVFVICGCWTLPAQNSVAIPEDYETFDSAALAYCYDRIIGVKYWSVHLHRRHVLHIHHAAWGREFSIGCPECKRRLLAGKV